MSLMFLSLSLFVAPSTKAWVATKTLSGLELCFFLDSTSSLIRRIASARTADCEASTCHTPASTSGSKYGIPYASKSKSSDGTTTGLATSWSRVLKCKPNPDINRVLLPKRTRLSWFPDVIRTCIPYLLISAKVSSKSSIASVGGTPRS